jgi:hypothetical protein
MYPSRGGTPGDRVGQDGRSRIRILAEEENAEGAAAPAVAPAGLKAVEPAPPLPFGGGV